MKRITLFVIVLLLLSTGVLFAQKFKNESEFYPKTFQIHKVFPHSKGYKIEFITQSHELSSFWAPIQWFDGPDNVGEIAYGIGKAYPYITFFYLNGELDHFRMYLIESPLHPSWGNLDPTQDYSAEIPSPDTKPEPSF
ncbi:MAG: hypothetical protein CSA76_06115 [Spirochaetales bacterium]|nr:MAG: hypothetical protein CSA76_06115 [Spirochaetales bacterium]